MTIEYIDTQILEPDHDDTQVSFVRSDRAYVRA